MPAGLCVWACRRKAGWHGAKELKIPATRWLAVIIKSSSLTFEIFEGVTRKATARRKQWYAFNNPLREMIVF
jgi:hypothetical protein